MTIYVSDTSIESQSTRLNINNNGNILSCYNQGFLSNPSNTAFSAGSNVDAYVYPGVGWSKIICPTVAYNKGDCYNPGTYRFTAPVTGNYFFQGNTYCTYPTSNSAYTHPVFYVNGAAINARAGKSAISYRIRQYGHPGGYASDNDISEILYLLAGDYVEYWHYVNDAGSGYYQSYTNFSGVFLG